MSEFDAAIAVPTEGDVVRADIPEGWDVGGAVNGGFLMAASLRALSDRVIASGGAPDAIAWSSHFLSASTAGPLDVSTEVIRVGRRFSSAEAKLSQDGDERVRTVATFADLDSASEPVYRSQQPPSMPAPDACIPATRDSSEFAQPITILDRLDLRLDPATAGFGVGMPSGAGELRGWIRFADGREADVTSLPFFADAFPPVTFDLGAFGWAPTIEFTGHVRRRPAPGWLRLSLRTTNVAGGLFEEDCVIWDSSDAVVAQTRQLGGVRMPSSPDAGQ